MLNKFLKAFMVFLLCLGFIGVSTLYGQMDEYVTLKKFLNAKMYGEAYNEILRHEITKDVISPELQKLRVNLLDKTKEQMLKKMKVNPDDPAIFTILADIAFQQSDLDNAMLYISKALDIRSGPMNNYVCAKILFARGNVDQAFDRMGNVLESMPDSQVVFEDFQFLYSCKNYGKTTAAKICKNSNFLLRATPALEKKEPQAPKSPFENDPTKIAQVKPRAYDDDPIYPDDYDEDEELDPLDDMARLPDEVYPNAGPGKALDLEDYEDLIDPFSDFDDMATIDVEKDMPPDPMALNEKSEALNTEQAIRLKQAEIHVMKAKEALDENDYLTARDEYESALKQYPALEDKTGVKATIDKFFGAKENYDEGVDYFVMGSYERARGLFESAYEYDPERYKGAAYYLGRIYLVQENPDYDKVLEFFEVILKSKEVDGEFRRETEWVKLQVLYEKGDFEGAHELFQYFKKNHGAYIKNKERYNDLLYGIYYHVYKAWLWGFLILLLLMFVGVAFLSFFSHSIFEPKDPVFLIKKAYKNRKYKKAIAIGEKAVAQGQPIQIEREILEQLVKIYFDLKIFEKSRDAARKILENFPENNVAWGYLASTSMATNDTSNEAIELYESIYKENPGNLEYLPVLAKHYMKNKKTSPEAMEILQAYYKMNGQDKDALIAIADGYVVNRTLSNEAVSILEAAAKAQYKLEYKELLARNYSKMNEYAKAVEACLEVLDKNIDNMGIHVVYTTSMKKQGKIEETIEQYKKFIDKYPQKNQLVEILNGLNSDLTETGTSQGHEQLPDLMDLPAELVEPDLPSPGEDFEFGGFEDSEEEPQIPLPDFLKEDKKEEQASAEKDLGLGLPTFEAIRSAFASSNLMENEEPPLAEPAEPVEETETFESFEPFEQTVESEDTMEGFEPFEPAEFIEPVAHIETVPAMAEPAEPTEPIEDALPTLDPFSGSDFLDEFADLPEEIGAEVESTEVSSEASSEASPETEAEEAEPMSMPDLEPMGNYAPQAPEKPTTVFELEEKLLIAREAIASSNFDIAIEALSQDYASNRNKEMGFILLEAWLGKGESKTAYELLETLDLDPEIMPEHVKDLLYQVGLALEKDKNNAEALKIYDMLCNVDINYKDVFDRSDKLYAKLKG
jgi:tetratricopeptide (TPR) repeat protein